MVKLQLEIDDEMQEFNLPNSWDDVTLDMYEKLASIKSIESEFEQSLEILSAISGMDLDTIYLIPIDSMEGILDSLKFIKEEITPKEVDSIKVDGDDYFLKKDFDKLTNGEVISLEMLNKKYKDNPEEGMAEMLCLFLRKKKENGKLENFKADFMSRADMFRKEVKVSEVNDLFVFFLDGSKK